MDSHLVTVEVSVERSANQWMKLYGLAFDQNGLKRLNSQTMQSRRPVQHHGMLFDHFLKNVPNNGRTRFNFLFRRFDGGGDPHRFQARKNKWFEQFQRHQFGQTALVQLEGGADNNDRTARVVDALAQQILPEASALAFDHVCQ